MQSGDVMESHTQATWEEKKWPGYEVSHIADKHGYIIHCIYHCKSKKNVVLANYLITTIACLSFYANSKNLMLANHFVGV